MLFGARLAVLATALILAISADPTAAAGKASGEARYYWDLTDLYPSAAAWDKAYTKTEARAARLQSLRGTLGDSPGDRLAVMTEISEPDRQAARLYV